MVNRPLWVTEWNNGANWTGCADPTFAQQQAAISAMVDMLESTPFVERYAIYNWVEDVRRVKWDDGSLTAAGITYRDQVSSLAYRQEMADAGVGSSARYAFDGDGHDGWGNGQDAMFVGAPKFTAGKFGQAVELNGITDYLQVSPRLGDSTDFSFAGWVFWNGGGAWQRIFDLGDDTAHNLFLCPRTSGGLLRFTIQNGSGEQQLNAPAVPVGVWTHLAVTISGTTGKLFVNGVPVATNTSMSINPGDVDTRFNFLGKSCFPADPLFSGKFDDFRFVSSALTDAQVGAIYATAPPRFRPTKLYTPDAPVDQSYSASLAGEATGTGPLTFSKMDGPRWLNVAANGALTGTPGPTNGGINNFLVRVTDTNGSLHTATLLIRVPTGSLTVSVASAADDAEQSASGDVNLTSTDLELVNDDATGAGNQLVGLRFNDIAIPPGAIITNATIQFTADESQTEPTTLTLFAEASADAAPFTAEINNLSARALVPLSVTWTPAVWTAGQANVTQRTRNLAGLVQEIISMPGWAAGNSIVFLISGNGHRTADSADKAAGSPARLTVEYMLPAQSRTAIATVTTSANDAEQSAAGGMNVNSTDLELVNDGALGNQTVGLRFEDLLFPPGAILTSADIQFTADEVQSETTSLTIHAQAADNAPIFTTVANDLASRPLTTAAVLWNPAPWNTIGERGPLQRTPDLSPLIHEVMKRPGWTSGNALAFLITGNGHRTAEAIEKSGGTPAALNLTYQTELPLGTFVRWSATQTNAGIPAADPDDDGLNNLMEYALGLDPAVPNHGAIVLALDSENLALTYTRPSAVIDLTYSVQWADTLGSTWTSNGVTQQIMNDDGARRTIRALMPKGALRQRFVRLKVTQ